MVVVIYAEPSGVEENEEFVCNILKTTSLVYLDFTPLPR
jgi:hypothetical protein